MGKSEKRNVTVFVVTGVLLASGIGLGVWQVGSPTAPATTDTATTSVLSTTRAFADPATGENADDSLEIGPSDDLIAEASPSGHKDPFLAPNAVLPSAPEHSAPTTTYRPDNDVPLSPDYRDDVAVPSDAGVPRAEPSTPPEPPAPTPAGDILEPQTSPSIPPQPEPSESDTATDTEDTTSESPATEPTTSPGEPEEPQDAMPPYLPPQDEPEPTEPTTESAEPEAGPTQQPAAPLEDAEPAEEPTPAPAATPAPASEPGSGQRPNPVERALSWFRW